MKLLFSLISFLFVELMSNMVLNVIRPIYNMCIIYENVTLHLFSLNHIKIETNKHNIKHCNDRLY